MSSEKVYRSFAEFYPFYLSEHSNRTCRRLHFTGTSLALAIFILALIDRVWWLVIVALLLGYGFAWAGHFFFERNRPATFEYPWFSFMGDWRLWWEILSGKRRF